MRSAYCTPLATSVVSLKFADKFKLVIPARGRINYNKLILLLNSRIFLPV